MMQQEITRTWAFAWRNVLMATQNFFTLFEMIFWPTVGVLSLGFMAQFLKLSPADTAFNSDWHDGAFYNAHLPA